MKNGMDKFISLMKSNDDKKDTYVNRSNGPVVECVYGTLLECIHGSMVGSGYSFISVSYTIMVDALNDSITALKNSTVKESVDLITENGIYVPKYHQLAPKQRVMIEMKADETPVYIKNGMIISNIGLNNGPTTIKIGSYVKIIGVRMEDSTKKPEFYIKASGIQSISPPKTAFGYDEKNQILIEDTYRNEMSQNFKILAQNVIKNTPPFYKAVEESVSYISVFIPSDNVVYNMVPGISSMLKTQDFDFDLEYPVLNISTLQVAKESEVDGKKVMSHRNIIDGKITSTTLDGEYKSIDEEDTKWIDCQRDVCVLVKASTGLFTEKFKGVAGINNYMYITDKKDWGYFNTLNHPDMVLIFQVSSNEGCRLIDGEITKVSHDLSATKVCQPIGGMISYLGSYGLLVDAEFSFELCHMMNDLDIITRASLENREPMLWYNAFTKEPSKEVRKDYIIREYKDNPCNTITSQLINLKEFNGNPRDVCVKGLCETRVLIGKKTIILNQSVFNILNKQRFGQFSVLDIIRHNAVDNEMSVDEVMFYNRLLIRTIFVFAMDANELQFYEDKKCDYIKLYYNYFNDCIKKEYASIFGKETCPYSLNDIKHDNFGVLKDLVFLPFAIKTSKVQSKKREFVETSTPLEKEEELKVEPEVLKVIKPKKKGKVEK
jgi:phage pi2 protein 07